MQQRSHLKVKGRLDWDSFPTFFRIFISDADAQVRNCVATLWRRLKRSSMVGLGESTERLSLLTLGGVMLNSIYIQK